MSDTTLDQLLPGATDVAFSEIEPTLARLTRDSGGHKRLPGRALTATVVVVGPPARLIEAAQALEGLGERAGVRAILIAEGTLTSPPVRVTEHTIAILGLAPQYVDNAVAALRLSSLPAAVWWRGGSPEALTELADLADRMVLDTDNPDEVWSTAESLFEQTAVTDLRWTRLTRWRSLLASLFDVPQVREAIPRLKQLTITARDIPCARLFAGWLVSALGPAGWQVHISSGTDDGQRLLESIQLSSGDQTIAVRARRTCMEASIEKPRSCTRVVPLTDVTLATWISEELAVRARDLAFEAALRAARQLPV
jgi:glucose-6-phosphate dehydrogenase assembly protein OpcA